MDFESRTVGAFVVFLSSLALQAAFCLSLADARIEERVVVALFGGLLGGEGASHGKQENEHLELAAQTADGDAQHVAVFGHGASGNGIAFLAEKVGESLVGERMVLVLGVDGGLEFAAHGLGGDLFALIVDDGLREAVFEKEGAKFGLHVFAVHHTGDCGDVVSREGGHILLQQGTHLGAVAGEEEAVLFLQDYLHDTQHGGMTLAERIDQEVGAVVAGAEEVESLFVGGRGIVDGGELLQEVLVIFSLLDLRQEAVVDGEGEGVVMTGDGEVGDDVASLRGVVLHGAGLGVEAAYARYGGMELVVGERELLHDTAVVVAGERLEAPVYNIDSPTGGVVLCVGTVELEGEAFLQVACGNAWRVHLLYEAEDFLHLLRRHLYALSECQVVGQEVEAAADIAGIVEAADNFLCNGALAVVEVAHGELVHEVVEERLLGDEDCLAGVLVAVALLPLAVAVVVIVGFGAYHVVGGGACFGQWLKAVAVVGGDFEDGVLFHLLFETLLQFHDRHLYQLHQQQLLRRQPLLHFHGLMLSAFHSRVFRG